MATALAVPSLDKNTVYSDWKFDVGVWLEITDVPQNKQGPVLLSAIATDHPRGIRAKVRQNLSLASLKAETGAQSLISYLDGILEDLDLDSDSDFECLDSDDERWDLC